MKNKIIVETGWFRSPLWSKPTWYILPSIQLYYKSDTFLETGVYTKAVTFQIAWLKWGWWVSAQEAY